MNFKLATILTCFLAFPTTAAGQQVSNTPVAEKFSHESEPVRRPNSDTVVGAFGVDRWQGTNEVHAVHYSGPPDLVLSQKQEWAKWHLHPKLRQVYISQTTVNRELVSYIAEIPTLEWLVIEGCKFGKNALLPLGNAKNLRFLEFHLSRGFPVESWQFLSKLDRLEEFDIYGDPVPTPEIAEHFASLTALKHLGISVDHRSAEEVIPRLLELRNARSIEIGWVRLPER